MSLLIQLIGSVLVLAAFAANQIWRISDSSRPYLTANALGSCGLAVSALAGSQWGFLALEGTWCLVSLIALLRTYARPRREHHVPGGSTKVSARSSTSETATKG